MCIAFVAQHSQKMFRCEPHDENNGSRLGLPISTIVRLAFFILYSGSHFGNWVLTDTRASEACGTAIRRAQCTCKFGTFCTLYLPDGNFTQNTKDGGVRMREKERKREGREKRTLGWRLGIKKHETWAMWLSVCFSLLCVDQTNREMLLSTICIEPEPKWLIFSAHKFFVCATFGNCKGDNSSVFDKQTFVMSHLHVINAPSKYRLQLLCIF